MKNEKAIATIEAMESALTAAKWALKQYTPQLEKNVELSKENNQLKKELSQLKKSIERERINFELYKEGLALCPQCDGVGGFEVQVSEFESEGIDCQECKTSGKVPLSNL